MEKRKEDTHAHGGAQGFPRVRVQFLRMIRKIFITILISTLLAVPIIGQLNFNVYAESSATVTREEAKEAFRAYCISRNLLVDGTVLGSAASWLGGAFDSAIDSLGIDMDYLQTQLSKVYDSAGFKWAFTASGIALYNRIFAELLQREDLSVGDEDVDKRVYSGKTFTDDDGNSCLVYIINGSGDEKDLGTIVLQYGSTYKYSHDDVMSTFVDGGSRTLSYNINNSVYDMVIHYKTIVRDSGVYPLDFHQCTIDRYNSQNYYGLYSTFTNQIHMYVNGTDYGTGNKVRSGDTAIMYNPAVDKFYIGTYWRITCNAGGYYGQSSETVGYQEGLQGREITSVDPTKTPDTDINITTPTGKPIKPSFPDDEPVSINPDGSTDSEPDNPDNPDNPSEPSGGTPPDWNTDQDIVPDGDGGFNIPFTLPDLNIDWQISGLTDKFPFCIPKDIVAICRVLNVEPEAPHFTGTVDLLIYDWQVDIDFSEFDAIGVIVRNGLFILFCIGLLVATRAIIRG